MTHDIPSQCTAVIFEPESRALLLEHVRVPTLRSGEVLVRVECCNICGSDAHTVSGRRGCPGPTVLGHEIVGHVAAIGPGTAPRDLDGAPLTIGQRITWAIARWCGQCFYCQRGIEQKCESLFKYGHSTRTTEHPLSGGLADYCVLVPGTAILTVEPQIPAPLAATINCALATAAGVIHTQPDWQDQAVLILGGGMLGLAASAMCRSAGARTVVVSDPQPSRRDLALRFGATHAVPPLDPDNPQDFATELSQAQTAGRGFDAIIDMSAAVPAIQHSPHLLRIGGSLVLIGSVADSEPVCWDPQQLVRKMIHIQGIHNYNSRDFREAVRFVHQHDKSYPWNDLFSPAYDLADAQSAFQQAMSGQHIRVALMTSSSGI